MSHAPQHLMWPFFEPHHRELAAELQRWSAAQLQQLPHPTALAEVDALCRDLVRRLGAAGWLRHVVAQPGQAIDTRAICLLQRA